MEIDAIRNSGEKSHTKKIDAPRKKFGRVEEEVRKKKRDEPENAMIDGPVTNPFFIQTSFQEAAPIALSAPVWVNEVTELMAPQLVTLSENGVSKTIMLLKSDHLAEIEVEIDHYDTHPSHFTLTFRTDQETQKWLISHQALLATSLKGALPHFVCTIAEPTFRSEPFKKQKKEKNSLEKSSELRYGANYIEEGLRE